MKDRLSGGDRLTGLFRCEMHTFWDEPAGVSLERLLDNGRYYNPNKHHYGHFEYAEFADAAPWPTSSAGRLDPGWPGRLCGTDLAGAGDAADLYMRLLGGEVPPDRVAVDVAAWNREQDGPVTSGVLWRLILDVERSEAAALGDQLAIARRRKDGLLVNPHMENWRSVVR